MNKEYTNKLNRFKTEVNDTIKTHYPNDVLKTVSSEESKSDPYMSKIKRNKEFYLAFAQLAFDQLKYDMELYETMKCNFSKFCTEICKLMKHPTSHFTSQIYDRANSFSPSERED